MLSPILDALPMFLIPLVIGLAVGVGIAAFVMSRRQRDPAPEALAPADVVTPASSVAATVPVAPAAAPAPAAPAPPPPPTPPVSAGPRAPVSPPVSTRPPCTTVPDDAPPAADAPTVADLLLVDDSAVARAKLRRLFEAAGYQVHLARDGVEALALLDKGRYALMITDLEMPNLDGVGLINACLGQPRTAGMPILAISGHENLRAKFNECKVICGIHRKPWIDEVLISHVASLVGARSTRSAETVDA